MPKYQLYYFNGRGRAEVARLLFAANGVEFEDIRIPKEEWHERKKEMPFLQLPVLVIDGKKFAQSNAICTYLAKEFGFYADTNIDALAIDQVVELQSDVVSTAVRVMVEPDETKKAEMRRKFIDVEAPKYLRFFCNLLNANGNTGYFLGSSLTVADLSVFEFLGAMENNATFKPDLDNVVDNYPELRLLREKVMANPGIKAHVDQRKPTPF